MDVEPSAEASGHTGTMLEYLWPFGFGLVRFLSFFCCVDLYSASPLQKQLKIKVVGDEYGLNFDSGVAYCFNLSQF